MKMEKIESEFALQGEKTYSLFSTQSLDKKSWCQNHLVEKRPILHYSSLNEKLD
jgi:hypothetical protein